MIAVPLLLRPLAAVPGLARIGEEWWDATSVYGYAGPIASHLDIPAGILASFRAKLHDYLQEAHVVAVFSRLHPLIPQKALLTGLGTYRPVNHTVSIDLTLPLDVQRARYRKNHKYGINKLKRLGITCFQDQNKMYMNEFIDIYYETMRRVNASSMYFFERMYFEKLA